ncbi:MAG: PilZ domain-containing protein [Candidatus Omnitrophica bacterium]|nr:PilZ domain-containing protein [Candidatus Omnitrophota bacterium]MBU4488805.1 PilZ domain-containing protein [Candidatus Omnitrophota bacterium]MCG2705462.1 PilZ domain-containing protein [Candidatus Omnitrophota bacterium]
MFWMKRDRKKIGEILVNKSLITEKQLKDALQRQRKKGERLGTNLADMGYLDEDEILPHVAQQRRIPFISLERYNINYHATATIPYEVMCACKVVPLDIIKDIITIAIADVPSEDLVKRIEKLTGLKVKAVMITKGDFKRYIETYNLSVVDKDRERVETGTAEYIDLPGYHGQERRRYIRFNRKLKVKYEFREEFNINRSINVSRGGVLVKSKSPIPENTHIILRMELPSRHEDIIVISRVVWTEKTSDEDGYLVALSFSSMDAADNRALINFIESLPK